MIKEEKVYIPIEMKQLNIKLEIFLYAVVLL